MPEPLENQEQQLTVIEANAPRIGATAYRGYSEMGQKGTVVILRQLENNSTELEDWQLQYRSMNRLDSMISDWKEVGLQDMIIRYNPEVSVVCTFLYPNGAHTSYHFAPEPEPPQLANS
ncbi:MAG: hypothetical protein J7641_17690 [Cyanobacteria bacterium SID2]|nr:hypothetical protein [Cyanobacteria bacterium SID2]MBP0003697.1 hypothetical protein [Cyanobacteria bacterium SBC]